MSSFQSSHPEAKQDWNDAMQTHLVYMAAALNKRVGDLRVLLLDAPLRQEDGSLGFPPTAWGLAKAGVAPQHIHIVERDTVGLAALR